VGALAELAVAGEDITADLLRIPRRADGAAHAALGRFLLRALVRWFVEVLVGLL
jgi:hypothetical protein